MTSLAEKYRPTSFDDVLGQDPVIRSLKRVVKDGRHHSFVFTGPSGTGKTTLARILASEFAGANRSVVNLEEVDAASKSGVNDVRELITRTLYRAIGSSPVKFIIIDEAHRLSGAAWEVLLKPIEEPPSHVYYALCTTEASKIPKTIITRCLRFDLKPVSGDLILDLLIKVIEAEGFSDIGHNDDIIDAVLDNANGSPRQALVSLEQCLGCRDGADARNLLRSAGQNKEVIDLARWLISGKGHTWAEAVKYLRGVEDQEAESVRIILVNYFAAVLLNTKSDAKAVAILSMLEAFKTPYYASDKKAPLMYSLGLALKLDN